MPAPNPMQCDDALGKGADLHDPREAKQTGHRHRDAQHAHDQRQPGGHQRPEHQQQHQRREGQRGKFTAFGVALGKGSEIIGNGLPTRDTDAEAGAGRLHFCRVLAHPPKGFGGSFFQRNLGHREGQHTVSRPRGQRGLGILAQHPRHALHSLQPLHEPVVGGPALRRVQIRGAARDQQHGVGVFLSEPLAQQIDDTAAIRILQAAGIGRQSRRSTGCKGHRQQRRQHPEGQHQKGPPGDEQGEGTHEAQVEHVGHKGT